MADTVVCCTGVTLRFDGHTVLDRFGMEVRRGEVFGLVGANGGSKTTILRLVAGLLAPDQGTCRLFGQDPGRVRGRIGLMPQQLSLYEHMTVAENLSVRAMLYAVANPKAVVADALDRFCLRRYARTRVAKLSGGWARRVQFAATLLHGPDLLLLDEPTAGLDAVARQDIWRSVLTLAEAGTTVLVSTHDLAEAERFSRLLFLVDGTVRASGTVQDVITQSEARSFLLGSGPLSMAAETPGVVAIYPSLGGMRVVSRAGRDAAALATQFGVPAHAVPPSLDDAAMALLHAAAA